MTSRQRWFLILASVLILGTAQPVMAVLPDMVGHWASALVGALQARGIVSGDDTGRFRPEDPLTRAEMAKLLVEGLGRSKDAQLLRQYPSRFRDVPENHWARGYIEALAEMAVTEGYGEGLFGPDDMVTRAQMAVFLVRAAGLSEQASHMRSEQTPYKDDAEVPSWARGAVIAALNAGLMAGFEDQTFRPNQPLTRAEASTTVLRLLAMQGLAYNLSGTLVQFDPDRLTGVVRDELGQERSFVMSRRAEYFRGGILVTAQQIEPLDQVWIVLGADGRGRFMEARSAELVGTDAVVEGRVLRLTVDGQPRSFPVQPGALIFYNGRPADLAQVSGAQEVYVALDRQNGEVRVLDAVYTPIRGVLVIPATERGELVVDLEEGEQWFRVAADAIFLLNGQPATQDDLQPDDRVRLALDETGAVNYVMAER